MLARVIRAILFIAVSCATAAPAAALEIEETLWGFDGQAVPYRFNPLSVLVSNPTPEPFDGALRLRRTTGAGSTVGAPLVEPLYVESFGQKWVQFYPYVMVDGPYELSWGRRPGEQFEVPAPRHGKAARIALADRTALQRQSGALKHFPENLFPPTVAALETLRVVALDHVPRWETVRRQALLDWLHAGGTLHVFQNAGRFPEFPAELAILNNPAETQRVVAGTVHRHARDLADLDREFIERVLLEGEPLQAAADANNAPAGYNPYGNWNMDDNLFSALKTMTRPDHNWTLLHVMSLVYLALIFPGMYFLGGKRADYRVVFAATAGLVVAFSWAFSYVGRRGYDETTTVNSVAIARPVAGGAWEATGWSNAFVTRGDFYTISHAGVGRAYSTCQNIEAVNGAIQTNDGLGAIFHVDIPPYSSRTFGFRAAVPGKPIDVRIEQIEGEDELKSLVIATGEGFPTGAPLLHAMYRSRVYNLAQQDGRLTLMGSGRAIPEFLPIEQYENYSGFGGGYYNPWTGEYTGTPDEIFQRLAVPLIGRSLGLTSRQQANEFALPDDRVRLFVYARMPEEFFLQNKDLGEQAGYVLYVIDLPRETTP